MTSASGTVVRQVCRAVEAGRGEEGDQGGGQRRIVVHGSKKTEFYAKNIFELWSMDDKFGSQANSTKSIKYLNNLVRIHVHVR